jgi:hypothetical protein
VTFDRRRPEFWNVFSYFRVLRWSLQALSNVALLDQDRVRFSPPANQGL